MLVNPYVHGNIQTIFQAENSTAAAKEAYSTISQYFNSPVYNYKFSLLKLSSDKVDDQNNFDLNVYDSNKNLFNNKNFTHFTVKESKNDNGVKFEINKYKHQIDSGNTNHLINNIKAIQKKYSKNINDSEQEGGSTKHKKHKKHKHHSKHNDDSDDSDDSSSSSPNYYTRRRSQYFFDPYYFDHTLNQFYWYYLPNYYIDPNPLVYYPAYSDGVLFANVTDNSMSTTANVHLSV